MAQPTIALPTGVGSNTPASVSSAVNAALVAETTYVGTLPFAANATILAPGIDDPTNTQTLGAPAIIRGTVYGHLVSGVTLGAGQTTAVQTATLTALNLSLQKASSFGKFYELEPNTYEIYGSSGLVVPASGLAYFKGSKNSIVSQFYANAPGFVLGDLTGGTVLYGTKIDGICVQYGVSQTGNTNANAIACGPMAWCTLENVEVTPNGSFPIVNPPYIALRIYPLGTWFNNCFRNIRLYGGQQSLFSQEAQGSGNLFQDMYMSNGSNNNASQSVYAALSGPAFNVANSSYSSASGNLYTRINIESVKCDVVMLLQEAGNFNFDVLHFENLLLNASGGNLIYCVNSNGQIRGMDTFDVQTLSGLTGLAAIQNSGGGESVSIDGLTMSWSINSNPGMLSPMAVIGAPGGNTDQNCMVRMRNFSLTDAAGNNSTEMSLYGNLYPLNYNASATYDILCPEFSSDQIQARTNGFQPLISGTTYTHYGAHTNAVLMVLNNLAAACTITLSDTQFPSGLGSSLKTIAGNTVRIRRLSGSYSNTLTVKDGAGTTLTTNTTAAADYLYQFNGTAWVVAT
jgi:hypothetical protein